MSGEAGAPPFGRRRVIGLVLGPVLAAFFLVGTVAFGIDPEVMLPWAVIALTAAAPVP